MQQVNLCMDYIAKIDDRERLSAPYVGDKEREEHEPVLIVIPSGRELIGLAKDAEDAMQLSFEQTEASPGADGRPDWPAVSPAAKRLFVVRRFGEMTLRKAESAWVDRRETPPWIPTLVLDSDEEVALARAKLKESAAAKARWAIRTMRSDLQQEAVSACRRIARAAHDSEMEMLNRHREFRHAERALSERLRPLVGSMP